MSSAALWLPPRWWPNSAYVTASNTDDLPLPLVPESIHSGEPSKRISCSSLYDRNPAIFTRCGIIGALEKKQKTEECLSADFADEHRFEDKKRVQFNSLFLSSNR